MSSFATTSFSWSGPVVTAHGRNSLKSYFETMFSVPVTPTTTSSMVELVQYILETTPSTITTEFPLRISTVRWMLQSCPKPVVSRVTVSSDVIQWICTVANSTEASIALRGLSLTVLSLIIRCFPRLSDDMLQPVTQCIASNLQLANELMSEKKMTNIISPTDILLHQCVDIMNSAGEDSLWIRPLHTSLGTAAMLIQQCYEDNQCAPAQRVVDANKVFGTVAATWLMQYAQNPSTLPCSSNNTFEHSALLLAPAVIVKILLSCDVVHDSFAYAFQLALDVVLEMEKHGTVSVDDHQLHHVFNDCLSAIEDADLGDVVMLKRVEALVGFVGGFYENSQSEQCRIVKNTKENAVMSCILSLQQRMVIAIQEIKQQRLNGSTEEAGVTTEQRRFVGTDRELRTCCADVRRACIAVAGAVLRACPFWVTDEPERFWTLTTGPRSLATPLLMGVGYRAILACTKSIDVVVVSEEKDVISSSERLRMRMVIHLANALRDVSKYSLAAADDIITAVRDLCEASQRGPHQLWWQKVSVNEGGVEEDIPLLLLQAYVLRPKLPSSVSSQNGKPGYRAVSSSDDAQAVQWKASVLSALRDTLKLGQHGRKFATIYDDLCLSTAFSVAFSRELTSDILLLHRCINVSSSSGGSGGVGGGVPLGLTATGEGLKENRRLSRERFGSAQGDVLAELLLTVTAVLIVFVEAFDRKHVRHSNTVDDSHNSHQSIAADCDMDKNKDWDKNFDKEMVRFLLSTSATTTAATTTMPNILSEASGHINELNDVVTANGTTEQEEVLPAHALISLLQLSRHLQGTLGRPTIFEDELAQTCAEADLVAKITGTLLHVQVPVSESINSNDKDEESVLMVEQWRLFVLQCIRGAIKSFCAVCYNVPVSTEDIQNYRINNDVDVLRYRACRDALLFIADNIAEILKTTKKKDSIEQLTTIFSELNALLPNDPVKLETTSAAEHNSIQIGIILENLFLL